MAGAPPRANFHRNLRDLMGDVIDPYNHYVLPSGHRLSRDDLEMLQGSQRFIRMPYDPYTNTPFGADEARVIQEMIEFMNSPPRGPARPERPARRVTGPGPKRRRPNPAEPPPPVPIPPIQQPQGRPYNFGVPNVFQFRAQGVEDVQAANAAPATSAYEQLMHAAHYLDKRDMIQRLSAFATQLPARKIDFRTLSREAVIKGANLSREDVEGLLSVMDLLRMNPNKGFTSDGIPIFHGNSLKIRRGQGVRTIKIRGSKDVILEKTK